MAALPRSFHRVQRLARLPIQPVFSNFKFLLFKFKTNSVILWVVCFLFVSLTICKCWRVRDVDKTNQQNQVTIGRMLDHEHITDPSAACKIASWLRKELPIRLSHRIFDFMRLPYLVVCNPNMQKVYTQYVKSLDAFLEFPDEIKSPEDEKDFAKCLETHLQDHGDITRFLQLGHRDLSIAAQVDFHIVTFKFKVLCLTNLFMKFENDLYPGCQHKFLPGQVVPD